ncbi:EamA family transporter RarD [Desulfobaculum bizertense]|uniref:Chloramphenicol-sensitive protein RarD n=1 Tax=Desulfobaculum bizertense DSM 18034 TaxID=1121442 RepID=A0A1T4VEQ8_9BACT|nr:EamA family transporter RarD [Desulfobaculum bizertense]UIJ37673.1 EamA family transporter RarD [Desulfobaculum bizertense]SKA63440.1 chloramphenicol-sensitive protein RarD [Desulfobaculum bizertense DSM 18034]
MTYSDEDVRRGLIATIATFFMFGLLPIYWKLLAAVPASEILCHRIVWSAPFIAVILTLMHNWSDVAAALKSPKTLGLLCISGSLIGLNWFTYIWSVNNDHVLDASLGYYINPLISMLLGVIFFRDKLSRLQVLAVFFAVLGVGIELVHFGRIPWLALTLAITFGLYGLMRKIIPVSSMVGLFFETIILSGPALIYFKFLASNGHFAFLSFGPKTAMLLVLAGAVTSIPLVTFGYGAQRLRLTTLGVLQYIGPTCMLLLGVFVYHEPFSFTKLITFSSIWVGVLIYTVDSVMTYRAPKPPKDHA